MNSLISNLIFLHLESLFLSIVHSIPILFCFLIIEGKELAHLYRGYKHYIYRKEALPTVS